MSVTDTPDYQRGSVSAQQLLATVAAGTRIVTVPVPANAETIVVSLNVTGVANSVACQGVTSNVVYAGQGLLSGIIGATWLTQFFDVSSAVDTQVTITVSIAPTATWFVYADTGIHITSDPAVSEAVGGPGTPVPSGAFQVAGTDGANLRTLRTDKAGAPYVIGTVPSQAGSDHPPVELSVISPTLAASGNILAAPGVGLRYRIMSVQLTLAAAGMQGAIGDNLPGIGLCFSASTTTSGMQFYPSGYPAANNGAIGYTLIAGAGNAYIVVVYTTETI